MSSLLAGNHGKHAVSLWPPETHATDECQLQRTSPQHGHGKSGVTGAVAGGSLLRGGTEPSFSQTEPSAPEMQVISILKEDLCVVRRADNVASYLLLTSALASAAAGPAQCPLSHSQGASGWPGKGEFVSYSYHGDFETTVLWRQDNRQQKSAAWSYQRRKGMLERLPATAATRH